MTSRQGGDTSGGKSNSLSRTGRQGAIVRRTAKKTKARLRVALGQSPGRGRRALRAAQITQELKNFVPGRGQIVTHNRSVRASSEIHVARNPTSTKTVLVSQRLQSKGGVGRKKVFGAGVGGRKTLEEKNMKAENEQKSVFNPSNSRRCVVTYLNGARHAPDIKGGSPAPWSGLFDPQEQPNPLAGETPWGFPLNRIRLPNTPSRRQNPERSLCTHLVPFKTRGKNAGFPPS